MCMKLILCLLLALSSLFSKKGKAIEPKRQNILHLAVSFVGQFYGFPNIETALL
jgi:hypothetical protein